MTNLDKSYFFIVIYTFLLPVSLVSQSKGTDNTLILDEGSLSPPAALSDVAWIAGHWGADALGGICEEIWSEPRGDSMMGMFRLIRDDKVQFFEILAITEENESLMLRLKHFNPDLIGWEEKDEIMEFPLVQSTHDEIYFSGLTMRKIDDDTMHIYLISKQGDTIRELFFDYRRRR
jgi:hypothetical protein